MFRRTWIWIVVVLVALIVAATLSQFAPEKMKKEPAAPPVVRKAVPTAVGFSSESCGTAGCHGGRQNGAQVPGAEALVFAARDPHAAGRRTLEMPAAKQIADRLHSSIAPYKDPFCTACHSPATTSASSSAGMISCQ